MNSSISRITEYKITALTKPNNESLKALIKIKDLFSVLIKEDAKFIEFIFASIWEKKFFDENGEILFETHSSILKELLIYDSTLYDRVLLFLFTFFLGKKNEEFKNDIDLLSQEKKLFTQIHKSIHTFSSIFNCVKKNYLEILFKNFPYVKVCTLHSFLCYFINCSSIYLYENKKNREKIIRELLEKLVEINSYITSNNYDEMMKSNNTISRLMNESLNKMFDFINKIILKKNFNLNNLNNIDELKNVCNKKELEDFYNYLEPIYFDKIIQIEDVTFVNSIIVYICGLDEKICSRFLNSVWNETFKNITKKPFKVCYFTSFLMSCKYLKSDIIIFYVGKIANEIHTYLNLGNYDELKIENLAKILKKHKYFYVMCICLFKLICLNDLKHEEFVHELQAINLQTIITSSLNPLVFCSSNLNNKLAKISKFYQLALCFMVINRNKRLKFSDSIKQLNLKLKLIYPFSNISITFKKFNLVYKNEI